jgi:hypothetical protein
MNEPLRQRDIEALTLAIELHRQGRKVTLEQTPDGGYECVEIVDKFSPETQAAIEDTNLTPLPDDVAAWLDALG